MRINNVSIDKDITDEQLATRTADGEIQAFEEIIDRYQTRLLRYASNLLRDTADAEDVVQDSLLSAYKNINSFDPSKKFSSWIYRIVHNGAISKIRKVWRYLPMLPDFDWPSGEDLEDDYYKKELTETMKSCLDDLDLKYREVMILYYLEDNSYDEISDILRLPTSTVGVRLRRAKIKLKDICKKRNIGQ
jgi:RNA polymerase sigma-70 factor, ECF subfamily